MRALRFWNHFDNDVKKCFIAIFLQSKNYIPLPDAPRRNHIARVEEKSAFLLHKSSENLKRIEPWHISMRLNAACVIFIYAVQPGTHDAHTANTSGALRRPMSD
ncbi:hypothetical protein [Xanthomonas cerealis]|uniref:hypothetical protein n=1 Tax=Xanthomonas cerealis TaxID=3390025 RepID=UPI001364A7B0|nr:hypothetical protein [Xanthomonas translucens]UKE46575.1 hypothetical protein KHA79_16045 [Xanthomonas translucens pv. cerealis]